MKIDWKQKLSSRKFWAAVVGFVSAVLIALHCSELQIEQIAAVITAGGVLIAYILGESYVDANRSKETVVVVEDEEENEEQNKVGFRYE